ncbi:NADPH-dependent FMN reductase [Paenibacillus brevis]|uniref:NADPH-dependent FMN reductase n=1 Tax=Paenibacillus brevis TaxID=2841508 RepID=A0ABS6FJE4_9BACL|nr:NADPH-dependent FMN reductase [Paenibacillus brevis]MBU5670296.1 NADPH-dependent FMN reductase [Paenibacillus brevis]
MAKVTVINGTPTPGSRLTAIIALAEELLAQEGIEVNHVNVGELPPEDLIHTKFESEAIVKANALVAEADAVIVASPVYKASYTGVLKTFLDLVPQKGLAGKIILPLFIGGSLAHLLSIDYSLKPVLSALGARHILGGVYTIDSQVARTEQGGFDIAEELQARLQDNIQELVQETKRRIASADV